MITARPATLKNSASIYISGLFSMGYSDFYIFLIPLYGLSLGMNATQVGMLVGARSALAVFLSIHVGALMDRYGTRRVTLICVWTGIFLAPVFPLVPWFWPLLLLQTINGGALSFAWSGSQTLIAQLADGEAEYIGRFSFFARIGTTLAPIIAGVSWDLGGTWAAYMLGALWGVALTVALLRAPESEIATEGRAQRSGQRFRLSDALPRLSDYINCFALLAIPAVATTMAIILLRTATMGVQYSLYVVYLHGIGLIGTTIGFLFAAVEIASGFGSLFAGRAMRMGDPNRTMLNGTVLSILLVCVTPFLGGIYALLLAAQLARGWLQGVVQPMMFSVQAKAVGRHRQGAIVGLRQTMNRLSTIGVPPIMGALADWCGPTKSFVVLGGLLVLLCIPITWITRRAARMAALEEATEPT
ncbi:MAG TPA: MFS transporter [Stellaceae bacterium]|jgi:MFS family permease|nr:MFS transporter [Stellaceae bacterium]